MMCGKRNLKLSKGMILNDLIKKFEENSPIVKSLNDTLLILRKIFIVGIIYFFIICIIKKYKFITYIFILTISLSCALYLIKKSAEILYVNSKHIGRNNSLKHD